MQRRKSGNKAGEDVVRAAEVASGKLTSVKKEGEARDDEDWRTQQPQVASGRILSVKSLAQSQFGMG